MIFLACCDKPSLIIRGYCKAQNVSHAVLLQYSVSLINSQLMHQSFYKPLPRLYRIMTCLVRWVAYCSYCTETRCLPCQMKTCWCVNCELMVLEHCERDNYHSWGWKWKSQREVYCERAIIMWQVLYCIQSNLVSFVDGGVQIHRGQGCVSEVLCQDVGKEAGAAQLSIRWCWGQHDLQTQSKLW